MKSKQPVLLNLLSILFLFFLLFILLSYNPKPCEITNNVSGNLIDVVFDGSIAPFINSTEYQSISDNNVRYTYTYATHKTATNLLCYSDLDINNVKGLKEQLITPNVVMVAKKPVFKIDTKKLDIDTVEDIDNVVLYKLPQIKHDNIYVLLQGDMSAISYILEHTDFIYRGKCNETIQN